MGDIYTTEVVVEDSVFSMGDFDRDYDVDMDDFANFNTCGVQPLPPRCEILDFDRDNQIGNNDAFGLMGCFTGPLTGTEGESAAAGGGTWQESAGQEATDPLDAMVGWCMATMTAGERAELAESIRTAAEGAVFTEAARMSRFADAIDPAE
jgi:hypothetical protein